MAQSHLDKAIARRLQRDRQNFAPSTEAGGSALGQGFEQPDASSRMIDIARVRPNPEQARTEFAPESIAELGASLKRDGQLQPILVRPARAIRVGGAPASTWGASGAGEEDGEAQEFEIVMGERRWRAARSIGMAQIRATVREIDDSEMLRLSLVENIQREDLNAVDRARTLMQLKQGSPGLTWNDIAADLGLSRQSISNLVALLRLPPDIQDDIRAGHLTEKHARALRQLEGAQQRQLSEEIKARSISGEAALAQARALRSPVPSDVVPAPEPNPEAGAQAVEALAAAVGLLGQASACVSSRLSESQRKKARGQVESARKYLQAIEYALDAEE